MRLLRHLPNLFKSVAAWLLPRQAPAVQCQRGTVKPAGENVLLKEWKN
ncbi:MAG: hypothetical protein HZA77_13830 [Candidatus Schekmanbacteria bacterium]|nr:hypothetical protein [Candidatus Schekmanbacteria bacterium]